MRSDRIDIDDGRDRVVEQGDLLARDPPVALVQGEPVVVAAEEAVRPVHAHIEPVAGEGG